MGRSQESFGKKEREKKKRKKKKEKEAKRAERQEDQASSDDLDSMIAYVDEYGNIVDTPPDPEEKDEVEAEDIVVGVPPKDEMLPDIRTGRVSFFNDEKGYGFIKDNDVDESHFVHITNAYEDIQEGDKVSFDLERGPKGMNAVNVKKQ